MTKITNLEMKKYMAKDNTIISLEILLLNDLLRINAIDKETYDEAIHKLVSEKQIEQAA